MDKNIINILIANKYLLFEYLKLNNIRYKLDLTEKNIRMDSIGSNNINGLILSLENMKFFDFKLIKKGNVLDLLSSILNKNKFIIIEEFYKLLSNKEIKINKLNINYNEEYKQKEIFNYPKELLELYPLSISELFLNDNIKESTQLLFNIRYDKISDRILIPVMFKGNLVGIIGRYNNLNVPKNTPKYYPLLSYHKSMILFGYDLCKKNINKDKKIILVESEKSVMKSVQLGLYNTLAVGGSNVSKNHIKLLKELNVKDVYLSFDSDKNLEEIIRQTKNWFRDSKLNVKIINNNTKFIKEKSCIFDMNWNLRELKNYLKENIYKI